MTSISGSIRKTKISPAGRQIKRLKHLSYIPYTHINYIGYHNVSQRGILKISLHNDNIVHIIDLIENPIRFRTQTKRAAKKKPTQHMPSFPDPPTANRADPSV